MNPIQYTPEVYHLTFGIHQDGIKIQPGQSIQAHLPDCDGLDENGKILPEKRFEQSEFSDVRIGNPLAGPFIIEDAEPGDTLLVYIEDIGIDRDFGRTGLSSRQVPFHPRLLLTDQDKDYNVNMPNEVRRWKIDRHNNTATMEFGQSNKNSVTVDLNPFPGTVAVAPANGEFIQALKSGPYGGNMDLSAVNIGSCLHLPVFCKGAFLYLGDIHAAQGDGEVIGGGIEVGGSITFKVNLIKGRTIAWPRVENDEYIGAIGNGANIHTSMELAYSQLILCLVQDYGFNRWDAIHLISQTVKASPGNFHSAICSINKKYLV